MYLSLTGAAAAQRNTRAIESEMPSFGQRANDRHSRQSRLNRTAARMAATGLLFEMCLLGASGALQAQTTVSLVKNTGQSQIATAFALHNSDVATAFTTGSNSSHGYMLKEVDLVLPTVAATGRPTFNVAIWGSTSGGLPDSGNVRGTLQHPTLAAGGNRFRSSAGIRLNDSTTYFVVVDVTAAGTNSNSISISSTPSNDEDAGAAAGWSIADDRRQRLGAAAWTTNVSSLRMDIRGYANSAPVCAAPDFGTRRHFWTGEVTVGKSPESTLNPGAFDYGFNATGIDDHGALSPTAFTIGSQSNSVDFVVVTTGGVENGRLTFGIDEALTYTQAVALELHACNVAIDLLAETDMPNATGYNQFVVPTTLDWSTVTTRSVYLSLPDNNAASGAPQITGTAQVGETLTAGVGTIADTDGLPTTTFPMGYEFQWVRVETDGTTENDITGQTSQTYTLADDDAGKTVKVKVSFKDQRYVASYTRNNVMVTDADLETRESAASNTVTSKPTAPQNFTATAGDTQVTLGWTAPADDGASPITKYQYRYAAGTTVADSVTWNDVPDGSDAGNDAGDETGVVVSSLVNGTEYAFEVRAVNAIGESPKNGPLTATPASSDNTAPRVASIERQTPSSSPTNADTLVWRLTFNEAVENVNAADFSAEGTTAGLTVAEVTSTVYDVTLTGGNLAGLNATVTLSFATGQNIQDAANNALTNTTPTGTDNDTFVVDNTAPTVAISDVPSTSTAAFTAKFTFSESMTGFTRTDITVGNGTTSNFVVDTTTTPANTVFTALITPTASGAVTVDVNANVATDTAGNGNTAAARVTSTVTDVDEPPDAPAAPTVAATSGSSTSLDVSWTAPVNTGRPPITSYDLRYCAGSVADCDAPSDFIDGPQNVTSTSATISGLTEGTTYQVQVRATNDEGDSGWSSSGSGSTVSESGPTDVSVADARVQEGPDSQLKFVVTLSHGGNALVVSYKTLSGTARKGVDSRTGNDFRAVRGELTFPRGVTSKTISVTVFNDSHNEGQETMGLQLTGVSDGGRIVDGNATGFIEDNPDPDGDGNTAPVFADTTLSRSIAENTAANTNVGAAIPAATDDDGDSLTYTMVGTDAASFDFDATARQIKTKTNVRYDFEKKSSYSVTIKVVDLRGGSDTVAVTVTLTDVNEPPPGPARVSVANARVSEGPGARLEFVVTLSHGDNALVVWYETANGTATAGQDYTAASGELFFPPGVTSKTLSVTVLDDSHDEGTETMRLRLTDVTDEGRIVNGTALGIIENTDPLPAAWIGRLGRTTADNVIEAVARRWERASQGQPETHFTLSGRRLDTLIGGFGAPANSGPRVGQTQPDAAETEAQTARLDDESSWARMDHMRAESLAGGAQAGNGLAAGNGFAANNDFAADHGPEVRSQSAGTNWNHMLGTIALAGGDTHWARWLRQGAALINMPRPGLRNLLANSSFYYSPQSGGNSGERSGKTPGPAWLGDWAAWGETAATRFSGADGALSLNGDVGTAVLGFDSRRERWLTGVALSYTEADGTFSHPSLPGGALKSALTTLSPYVHFELSERSQLWGVLGYGTGELTLTPARTATGIDTGLQNALAAFGGRTTLSVAVRQTGRLEFALRTDARFTETTSDAASNLMGAAGSTSRVRALLEGRGAFSLTGGATLTPTLEAGLRYDGGDVETGGGIEMGAGLGYAAGRLAVQIDARGLLAHEDTAYEEWGYSATVGFRPRADGKGLSMNIGSVRGAAQSGVQTLWNTADTAGLARGTAAMHTARRLRTELGYGFGSAMGRMLFTPYLNAETEAYGGRTLGIGVRLSSGIHLQASLELGRRESLGHEAGLTAINSMQMHWVIQW